MASERAAKLERRPAPARRPPEEAGAARLAPRLSALSHQLNSSGRVAALSALSAQLNARPSATAPVQMTRFGTAPRFQQTFTTRTGLQGVVLGSGRSGAEAARAPVRRAPPPPPAEDELPGQSEFLPAPPAELHAAADDAHAGGGELAGASEFVPVPPEDAHAEDELAGESQFLPLAAAHAGPAAAPPTPAALHARTVEMLGEPVNNPPTPFHGLDAATTATVGRGNAASMRLLNELMVRRAPAGERALMIHHAAAGAETGVGVCDTYAALTAINARIGGHGQVRTTGNLGHRYAVVGDEVVDPWRDPLHRGRREGAPIGGDTDLSGEDPAALAQDFAAERAAVQAHIPNVLTTHLTPAELADYHALHALRTPDGGYGTMHGRVAADERAAADRRERDVAREARRQRLLEARAGGGAGGNA